MFAHAERAIDILCHVGNREDGRIVSAREALIILTSDLHQLDSSWSPGKYTSNRSSEWEMLRRSTGPRASVFSYRAPFLFPFCFSL